MNLRPLRKSPVVAFLLAFVATGCLPYSCSRIEPRALTPEDSVSRDIAASVRVDTLILEPEPQGLELKRPRTALFLDDGTLYVSDVAAHRLIRVSVDGNSETIDLGGLRYPYLVGVRGGIPVVFSPEARTIAGIGRGGPEWTVTTSGELPMRALQYAAASDSALWIKIAGPDVEGSIRRLDQEGRVVDRTTLPPPFWRWAGMLRAREGGVVSFSGYRPTLYTFGPGIDSTALFGFDSPMLARSRLFLLGTADQPPLMIPSGALLESWIFVLNVRPGWLRVDVYDDEHRLSHVLVEPDPSFDKDFYPTDLAVRREADGSVRMAVTVTQPRASIRLYRWDPSS